MLFHTTESYFEEVLAESRCHPVLLDFYAGWCAPCRELASELDALSDRYADWLTAYSINTDTDAALAERYAVDKLPAVLLLRDGQTVLRWEAHVTAERIAGDLEKYREEDP